MSAYSDWKCGALTDEEYRYEMRRECGDPKDIPFWSEESGMNTEKSITKIIEETVEEMCNKYCKWPEMWDEEMEGCELCESSICRNCPLNRLV